MINCLTLIVDWFFSPSSSLSQHRQRCFFLVSLPSWALWSQWLRLHKLVFLLGQLILPVTYFQCVQCTLHVHALFSTIRFRVTSTSSFVVQEAEVVKPSHKSLTKKSTTNKGVGKRISSRKKLTVSSQESYESDVKSQTSPQESCSNNAPTLPSFTFSLDPQISSSKSAAAVQYDVPTTPCSTPHKHDRSSASQTTAQKRKRRPRSHSSHISTDECTPTKQTPKANSEPVPTSVRKKLEMTPPSPDEVAAESKVMKQSVSGNQWLFYFPPFSFKRQSV